ncbi:MAG: hypothetical protein P8X96_14395 [Desulfobacteraceae bacterium]
MNSEDRLSRPSIDAAVAKELKLRQVVTWCLWGLIALALALTGWILYKGTTLKDIVKQQVDVAGTPELVAQNLSADKAFLTVTSNKIASKTDMQEGIVSLLKKDDAFGMRMSRSTSRELASKPGFVEKIADELKNNAEFIGRIAKTVPVQEAQINQSSLAPRLSDAEQQLIAIKSAIAQQRREIADIKGRQTQSEKSQISATKNIEKRLSVLAQDVESIQRAIEANKRDASHWPRHYLLKTSQWNDLTALGMEVKIGYKMEDAISEFSIQKGSIARETESAVPLGKPFLLDVGNECYRIELTYVVTRFLVRDYVGMEIALVPGGYCQ